MPTRPAQELREFHRIRFPISQRNLRCEGKSFAVIDVSVRGLRYAAPGVAPPQIHDTVAGTLRFRRGAQAKIEGVVVRVQNDQIALHLTKEIPVRPPDRRAAVPALALSDVVGNWRSSLTREDTGAGACEADLGETVPCAVKRRRRARLS